MSIVITPIPSTIELAAPAFTLGTANTAGAAVTAVSSNSTLLTFDATVPTVIATGGDSAGAGSATVSSRRDHQHGATAVIAAASDAEMVSASSTTVYASPGTTDSHPGVAKAYCKISEDGATVTSALNILGVTTTTGKRQISWTTDFGSANYICVSSQVNSDESNCGFVFHLGMAVGLINLWITNEDGDTYMDSTTATVAFGAQ